MLFTISFLSSESELFIFEHHAFTGKENDRSYSSGSICVTKAYLGIATDRLCREISVNH